MNIITEVINQIPTSSENVLPLYGSGLVAITGLINHLHLSKKSNITVESNKFADPNIQRQVVENYGNIARRRKLFNATGSALLSFFLLNNSGLYSERTTSEVDSLNVILDTSADTTNAEIDGNKRLEIAVNGAIRLQDKLTDTEVNLILAGTEARFIGSPKSKNRRTIIADAEVFAESNRTTSQPKIEDALTLKVADKTVIITSNLSSKNPEIQNKLQQLTQKDPNNVTVLVLGEAGTPYEYNFRNSKTNEDLSSAEAQGIEIIRSKNTKEFENNLDTTIVESNTYKKKVYSKLPKLANYLSTIAAGATLYLYSNTSRRKSIPTQGRK